MSKHIDVDKLKTTLEARIAAGLDGYGGNLKWLLETIDSLQQEQPEYGYFSTTYIHGKKARWNVGDTLAYYLCTSNEEGEIIIGKITKVEFSDKEGWVYTSEDESVWDEQSLAEEGVYKITKNGK